jgi:hypothetical protein
MKTLPMMLGGAVKYISVELHAALAKLKTPAERTAAFVRHLEAKATRTTTPANPKPSEPVRPKPSVSQEVLRELGRQGRLDHQVTDRMRDVLELNGHSVPGSMVGTRRTGSIREGVSAGLDADGARRMQARHSR